MKRLTKTKSQEILDSRSSVSPPNSTGIMSKMKKVLGSYGSSPLEKRRAKSLEVLGNGPTFGVPLEDLLSVEPVVTKGRKRSLQHPVQTAQTTRTIPFIVSKIIENIEQNGLRQEGIYRVNGNARAMDCLKVSFDRIGDADFTNEDIFSVGGVLKLFLRELPVSLIPEQVIDEIVELQEDKGVSNGLSELCLIIQSLPQAHYDLLKALCKHLLNVSQFSDKNKMTAVSLSIVFGPSVMKCGGGLGGLKKQGNANAAFSKMIQNYSTVFEDDSVLDILAEQSSDGSFGSRFRKIRKKPKKPDPYHKHIQQKLEGQKIEELTKSSGNSLDEHDSHGNRIASSEMDEAIDQAFEAVIKEDIEAGTRKQQRKSEGWLATPIVLPKPKGLFQSDDLTARVASPYSWKSSNSAGTSPTTSPAISPRTSEVFTTLIGDSVQDHLFETQVVTTSFSNYSTEKDPVSTGDPSISHTPTLESITNSKAASNDDCISQPAVVRRSVSRGSQNRKSAVYGSAFQSSRDASAIKRKFTSVGDLNVELLTVNNGGKCNERSDDGVTLRTGTVSNIVKQLSEENGLMKEPGFKTKEPMFPRREEKHDKTSSDLKNNVEPPSNLVKIIKEKLTVPPHTQISTTQSETEDGAGIVLNTAQGDDKHDGHDELDYVTRTNQSLFHPTLQRIRVPFKRAKPSRRSMLLRKATEKHTCSSIDETRDSGIILEPKGDSAVTGKRPSFQKQQRNISVSSVASASSVSRISSLSSPPEVTPDTSPSHNILTQNVSVIQTTEGIDEGSQERNKPPVHALSWTGVAPEERPAISKAWSKGDLETDLSVDISTMSYEELLRLAQKLRSAVREYDSEFVNKQFRRKPSMQDQQSVVGMQAQLLATVKRKLKEMRASDGHLSKTVPASVGKLSGRKTDELKNELLSSSATKLDQPSPNLKKKSTHLSRHQSLLLKPVNDPVMEKESSMNWLVNISRKMQTVLSERRDIADRPEDLSMMTYEQLLDEKQAVQKLLLNFERTYKRPETKEEKDVMRPIYDRYREIKRQLVNYGSKRKSLNLTKTEGASSEDTTLESVSILQASQSSNYRGATNDSLASSHGPSAFVLPLSPDKRSNRKHKKLSSSSFETVPTSVLRTQLSMESKDNSSPVLATASSNERTVEVASVGGNFMSSEELKAASISELNCQLALLVTRKKQLRKELRQFEHEFEEKYKRLLTKDDKKLKFQQYVDYRDVKSKISEISELLTAT